MQELLSLFDPWGLKLYRVPILYRYLKRVSQKKEWNIVESGTTSFTEDEWPIYVESKVSRTTAADIIRQINLYREHLGEGRNSPTFVLATPTSFTLTASEADELKKNNILWVQCGPDFETWFLKQQATQVTGTQI